MRAVTPVMFDASMSASSCCLPALGCCQVGLMEAMDYEHLGVDLSHRHVAGSSILGEAQVSLCDASMKREASQMDEQLGRKTLKKRRSSLSSHRRSITGGVVSAFQIGRFCVVSFVIVISAVLS